MTTATPPAPQLERSASILAPLLVAVRDIPGSSFASPILHTAAESVPETTVIRKILVGRKNIQAPFTRLLYLGKSGNAPYSTVVRCADRPAHEGVGAQVVNWDVNLVHLPAESYQAELPDAGWVVRLDVTHFRLCRREVVAAAQLALFRHLFVECYRAIDPAALVLGGQHDWRAEWWPIAQGTHR